MFDFRGRSEWNVTKLSHEALKYFRNFFKKHPKLEKKAVYLIDLVDNELYETLIDQSNALLLI